MSDRVRLPLTFDAAAMQADVRGLGGEWIRHFVTQNYEGEWTVLPLRAPASATHPVQMIYSDPACDAYVDTPLLEKCPAIAAALAQFRCPIEAVRLMRLAPGSLIKTHRDHDLDIEHGRARLHVPVATNAGVDFRLNGERVVLDEGECWYLRLSDPHSVANHGAADRVHLVIDAIVSPWLRELLERAGCGERVAENAEDGEKETAADDAAAADNKAAAAESWQPVAESRKPEAGAWVPTKVAADGTVEWCELGDAVFADPFFERTIERLRKTARIATTPLDVLIDEAAAHPGLPPTAFIFHCSRCGSTLVSQLARAVPGTVVISEAPPIDDVLRSSWPEAKRITALRAVVAALGQPRRPGDARYVIKFDAWHVLDLPLIQEAFPGVPCVFVERATEEVVASQMRMPSRYLLPGMLDPTIGGVRDAAEAIAIGREAYCARVVGRILLAGEEFASDGRVTRLNYRDFPDAAIAAVQQWTGRADEETERRLRDVAAFDAKTPSLPFERRAR